ncbi:MAG: hypothetical protein ACRDRC_09230, partial [Pseudonocardiaceae bacterium]
PRQRLPAALSYVTTAWRSSRRTNAAATSSTLFVPQLGDDLTERSLPFRGHRRREKIADGTRRWQVEVQSEGVFKLDQQIGR